MCGIAGFISTSPGADGSTILGRMTDSIRHRGPDDTGVYSDGVAWLGHRRLSIIDLATGHQPIANEDETLWIVYNGEIFNHSDVRAELEARGHRYRTRSDTETILHSYEEYGPGCVERFRGMFAFAMWDTRRKTLFCARDRLGIKPFYYYWDGRFFAFASEIKALLAHPRISASFDESVLPDYLGFGYTSDERTMFAGIRKLMPGHRLTLEWNNGEPRLSISRYWDVPDPDDLAADDRGDEWWIAECRRRLEETVRMRLMSDVPLGMFLSGGVDSSAIAAVMKRIVPDRIQTFSVGYDEGEYSELGYARRVADVLGTDHHEVRVSRDDFFGALPKLVWHEDEPIAWPSSVSLYFVSRLAASRVKVVLTGEGSDELFGGYSRYRSYMNNARWLALYSAAPAAFRDAVRAWVADTRLLSAPLRRKIQHTFVGRPEHFESLYLDNFYSGFGASAQATLLRRAPAPESVYAGFNRFWNARPNNSVLQRLLYSDQKTYLVELLMKQDQMSMATSIESRVPLLDHKVVEFAAAIPERLKVRNGSGKYIFKQAVADLLPADIIHRRKMGFPTPLSEWLRGPAVGPLVESVLAPGSFAGEYMNTDALRRLVERHAAGIEDATERIWRVLNFQIWGDLFITGKLEPVPAGAGAAAPPAP